MQILFVQKDVLKLEVQYFKNEFNFSLILYCKNSLIIAFDYTFLFPEFLVLINYFAGRIK
jgi:hypothetical protein